MNYIIKQLFLKDKRSRVEKFRNILSFASTILEGEHPNIIYDLIYSLGKPYQLKIINDCIMGNSISPDTAFREEHLFFKHANDKYRLRKTDTNGSFINFHQHLRNNTLSPTSTLIYTFPWSNERLRNAFNNIGGKVGNPWINDSLNHRVTYFIPINIGYVANGNHSTAINIINNEAPMNITEEIDLAPIYDEIYTDGIFFRRISDDSIVDEVASTEFAAIFEIGRLIINKNEHKIDFLSC